MEGLATYVSETLNPTASKNSVFMSKKLAEVKNDELKNLAITYLKDINKKAFDSKNQEVYNRWFSARKTLNKNFPNKIGYWLGYYTVKHLAKYHSINEMIKWDTKTAHKKLIETLRKFAGNN